MSEYLTSKELEVLPEDVQEMLRRWQEDEYYYMNEVQSDGPVIWGALKLLAQKTLELQELREDTAEMVSNCYGGEGE